MARLEGPNWVDELPWVLLGIRTAPKEDLHSSSAELVYGAPLVVPGEFIPAPRGQEEEPTAVLDRLRERLGNLAPIPTSQHGQSPTCVPEDLQNCLFVRRGGHRAPLQRPYEGPFKVIRNNGSTFVLDIGGREEVFTVDRLKPAHVDLAQPVQAQAPRRRGRPPKQRPIQNAVRAAGSPQPAPVWLRVCSRYRPEPDYVTRPEAAASGRLRGSEPERSKPGESGGIWADRGAVVVAVRDPAWGLRVMEGSRCIEGEG
ncbi:uncharacterized protein LOC134356391 [Mobula hypostoma]|uniref:uncharacterized protein LOC134356391 n=1 Tax=Mobula hypostoma TaxID=723540 RepID=UPI002FC2749A